MILLEKIGPSLKAWAALVGLIATALIGEFTPDDPVFRILTIVIAVTGAIGVYVIPNVVPLDDVEHRDLDVPAEPDLENPIHEDEELTAATQAFHGHGEEREPRYDSLGHQYGEGDGPLMNRPGEHRRTDI